MADYLRSLRLSRPSDLADTTHATGNKLFGSDEQLHCRGVDISLVTSRLPKVGYC